LALKLTIPVCGIRDQMFLVAPVSPTARSFWGTRVRNYASQAVVSVRVSSWSC